MKTFLIIALIIVALNVAPYAISFVMTTSWGFPALIVILVVGTLICGIVFAAHAKGGSSFSDTSSYGSSSSYGDSSNSSSDEDTVTEADVVEALRNILRSKPGNHIAFFYNSLGYFRTWKSVDEWGRTEIVDAEFDGSQGKYYFLTRDQSRYYVDGSINKEEIYYFDVT